MTRDAVVNGPFLGCLGLSSVFLLFAELLVPFFYGDKGFRM